MKEIATVAATIADESRAAMLDLLLDGGSHSAGELADAAGVAASTASEHLARLERARLVTVATAGRSRLYRLAAPEVASVLEALGVLAQPAPPRSLRGWTRLELLRAGRTCYDHLAGELGVAIADAARAAGAVTTDLTLADGADEWFAALGVHLDEVPRSRRPFVRGCLDWTERREHLAGALGAAVCATLLANGWITMRPRFRAVRLTTVGAQRLQELGIELREGRQAATAA